VPREAAGQGFSLVAEDEAVVRVAFRLFRDNQGQRCHSGQINILSTEPRLAPDAVAVAEIDRESSLAAEGDDGGVVDLEEVERGRRPSVARWPAGNAAT
jgi:hypothetical protein